MPVQQISVIPARETASSRKSTPRSKDKNEGGKAPGQSGSRSSNISKASSSAKTSITPSPQDICSSGPQPHVEKDTPDARKQTRAAGMTVSSTIPSSSTQSQKKQVKRRHRRKRDSCTTVDCIDTSAKQQQTDHSPSTDHSERGEKRERAPRSKRELPPRLRGSALPQSESTSEDEGWRQARSWSKEKARRGHRRSGSSREMDRSSGVRAGKDRGEAIELQSVGSDEGKESQALLENGEGLKKRHSGGGSGKTEGRGLHQAQSHSREKDEKRFGGYKSHSPEGSSFMAEEGDELITKRYQERGSGGGDMAVPTPRKHCGINGSIAQHCSDDSELEVCRICHCEGDEECPLITPCWCTGSLRFVHGGCLNQWIKSSDTRCCELCKFDFIMETQLKPLCKWEKLQMTKGERRKILCSVLFHLIAIGCVLWSVYVLAQRTAEEIRLGRNGILEWPFWTKLIVVAIGFTGGLIFMYIQCKVYLQLWRRLKAFNRIITVQNCPEKASSLCAVPTATLANGKHENVEVPIRSTIVPAPQVQTDSDQSVEAAVAPQQNPV